jgi:cytochrome c oxidase subunit 1
VGAYILAVSVIPFYINVLWSWSKGPKAGDNPWNALTLEWTTASPPIIENWEVLPVVTHGPYEYGYEPEKELETAS